MGTYYVRAAEHGSARIDSPALWKEVIRSCALSDKSQLLGALSAMMSQPVANKEIVESILDHDIDFIIGEWVDRTKHITKDPQPDTRFGVFGFELLGSIEKIFISVDQFLPALKSLPSRNLGPYPLLESGYNVRRQIKWDFCTI